MVDQRFLCGGLSKKFHHEFESLNQALDYRLSITRGYDATILLLRHNFDNISLTTNRDQSIAKLLAQRIDIILSTEQQRLNRFIHA